MRLTVAFSTIAILAYSVAYSQMPEYKGSYRELAASKTGRPYYELSTRDSTHSFDALAYTFNLTLSNNLLSGGVSLRFRAVDDNISQIDLHFIGMTVDSVRQGGAPISYSRTGGMLYLDLLAPLAAGDSATVDVYYHGTPQSGFYFATNSYSQPVWYSFTEPSDSRYWFPCWDEPWDKAYSEITVTAPNSMKVTGNGYLAGYWDGPGPGNRTWHWIENFPISTYLISIAACDFAVLRDSVFVGGTYLPLTNYVYHGDSAEAAYDFANTGAMISFYSERFGTYPFMGEKYSMSATRIFNGWGAMEHQTNTTFGDALITGYRYYEWIVAHELGHQWFGDKITCLDWRNIWLNESFATYLDGLFSEHFYGQSAFHDRMTGFRNQYFNEDGYARYPIYDPPPDYLFGAAEYEKGAWVLHMLRHVMADSAFFDGMHAYSDSFAYGNASTDDFQSAMEAYYGDPLGWFFGTWIYDQGYPVYRFGWDTQAYNGQTNVLFQIRQDQSNAPVFTMPVDIRFQGSGFDTTVVFWNSLQNQHYSMFFPSAPSSLTFDPGDWILKVLSPIAYTPMPDIVLDLSPIYDTLDVGSQDTVYRSLGNAGKINLDYSISSDTNWVKVSPATGSVTPGQTATLTLIIKAPLPGEMTVLADVSSNDPDEPVVTIPCFINVSGSPFIPGDANNSGDVNGVDVTYLVNYLKGFGPPPDPMLLGDANGNCDVNGVDVVYLVNYLKGFGPPPFAGDCR